MRQESSGAGQAGPVTVYWRPGCPYCMALRTQLRLYRLPRHEVNIWEEPAAAAVVRSVAEGNETVPTVVVGECAMVNPSIGQVVRAVREHAPELAHGLPEPRALDRRRTATLALAAVALVAAFVALALL